MSHIAADELSFLSGDSEMARLIRTRDWSSTSLGEPPTWPQALRTCVRLMLNTKHPIFLFWGPEAICLYNDGYRSILGRERHAIALGNRGAVVWAEIWDHIGPQVEQVLAGRGATWHENDRIPLTRDGKLEDTYWTYSYSPIDDERAPNGVGGVLVLVTETTQTVLAEKRRAEETERQRKLFDQAPSFVCILNGPDHVFEFVNNAHRALFNSNDWIGKPVREAFPDLEGQGFFELLDQVYNTAERFVAEAAPVRFRAGPEHLDEVRLLDFIYEPMHDEFGKVTGIFCEGFDVTERARADAALRESEQRLRFLTELDEATRSIKDAWDIMDVSTRMLGEFLDVSRCAYADMDDDEDHFTIRADYCARGIASTVGHYSLERFGSKAVSELKAGRTLVLRDVDTELLDADGRGMFHAIGINAIITCPLVKDGRLNALMAVHHADAHDWTGVEIRLVEAVVQRCWAHIERIRSDEAVRESERELRDLIDAIPQQVWTARPDGYLDYVNAFTQHYIGDLNVHDGVVDWAAVIYPDDVSRSMDVWSQSVKTGEDYEVEQRIKDRSGKYRWNLSRARPVRDESNQIIKWYGTNTDIEDQKCALAQVVESRNAAEAANMAKSEFLANMSHEIRTPMNAVIGLSTILAKSSPLTTRQREFIHTLQMSADSLLALINDLLDIAKIESRSVELEHIPFSMPRLIQEVTSMMAVPVREKGLRFTAEGDCVDDKLFLGDPTRLRQIILNLCSNAIKFTSEGGIHVAITCHCGDNPSTEKICISVTDTGIGIAPDKIDSIFNKFVQADSSISRRYGGTGLGLAITKTLAEIMGGTISVESTVGKGSTFTVCVPLEIAGSDAASASDDAPSNGQVEATVEDKARLTVLLVEDFPANILVATTFLEDFGYRVDVAENGLEAFEKAKVGSYMAALMDVQMPGINGLDATKMIRAYERQTAKPALRIIGMTAHAMAGDRERCLGVGMDDYISKPFNPAELHAKLAAQIV